MEVAKLAVTLDASKAIAEARNLEGELLKVGNTADNVARRANAAFARLVAPVRGISGEFRAMQSAASNAGGQVASMATTSSNAIERFRREVNATTHSFQQMATQASTAAATISSSFTGLTAGVTRTLSGINRLTSAFGIYLSVQGARAMADALIESQIASQRLNNTITLTAGSAENAKTEIAFLRAEANRAGTDFVQSATAFARFQSAASGTAITSKQLKEIFISVTDATSRLHLDAHKTSLVFLALEQMISKGVVSMEELRRQLGNNLPGAFQIAARSMGATQAEFMKMVESGQVLSEDFLPKFAAQLKKDIPIGDAVDSLSASINRLKNSWLELKTAIGDGINFKGAFDFLGRGVQGMSDSLSAARLLEQNGGGSKTEGMFNLFRGGLPGSAHRYANAQNYGELTPEQRAGILSKEFPFAEPVELEYKKNRAGVRAGAKDFDFLKEYQRMKALNPMAEDFFHEMNPPYGPPAPEPEKALTDKQKEAMEELIALRDKLTTTALGGLEKEEAQIDINLRKQLEAIERLAKETAGMEGGAGYNDVVEAMNAASSARFDVRQKEADKKSAELMKQQAEEARDLTAAYKQLLQIEEGASIGGLSGKDKELAEANRKYKEQYQLLMQIDETLDVQESTYAAINQQHEQSISLINQKYDRTFVGEGTLVELSRRRLELERELVTLREDSPGSAAEAKRLQEQIQVTERQINSKLMTGDVSAADAFIYGWERAGERFTSVAQGIAKVGEGLANSLSNNLTNSIMQMIDGSKSFKEAFADMARAVVADLIRIMIQQLIVKALMSAFGGGGGGGVSGITSGGGQFASSAYHSGGVAGSGGHGGGNVSAMMFAGAQRYHTGGVLEDEVPIIARKGEGVFTPEQMAAMGQLNGQNAGGKSQKVEIINITDPRMVGEYLAANPQAIINVVSKHKSTFRKILA